MGITQRLGTIPLAILTDASNNVGIGAAPSGSYKLEVTGTAKVSSTILVSGAATFSSSVGIGNTATADRLSVTGIDFQNTAYLLGGATTGASYGLQIRAGSNSTDYALQISNRAGGEMFRVRGDGNVGIGTNSPSQKLEVAGADVKILVNSTDFATLQLKAASVRTFNIVARNDSSGVLAFYDATADVERMRIKSGGDVQVNNALYWIGSDSKSYGFQQLGDGFLSFIYLGFGVRATINGASGAYVPISDINVKKDFEDSTIGLSAIMSLRPTLFRFKEDLDNESQKELGFIAQQVREFIPQAYQENGSFIGLQDRPIIAALVKAVQEQQAQIEELNERLNKAGL
jgi:hypothetical protein